MIYHQDVGKTKKEKSKVIHAQVTRKRNHNKRTKTTKTGKPI